MTSRDRRISDHLVRLIQIVFALVIAQSLVKYSDVLTDPLTRTHAVAALALIGVYITTVFSWIDWHTTMEINPYNLSPYNERRKTEILRLWTDLLVVTTYAYLLFTIAPFVKVPGRDIFRHLLGYPLVFALYLVAGVARKRSYGPWASHLKAINLFLMLFVGSLVAYRALDLAFFTGGSTRREWLNFGALLDAITTMVLYRLYRGELRSQRRRRKAKGHVLGFDMDGVLANQIHGVLPRVEHRLGISLTYDDVTDWRLRIGDSDIAKEILMAMDDPEYILKMPVHKGAKEILDGVFLDNTVLVITARPPETRDLTEHWLNNAALPHDRVISVAEGKKSVYGADVLVDDYLGNLIDFLSHTRGVGVLLNQPWNQNRAEVEQWLDDGRLVVAQDLYEAHELLRRMYP